MKRFHSFLLLLLSLIVFTQCNHKKPAKPAKVDPAFSAHIVGYTNGIVAKDASIRIILRDAMTEDIEDTKVKGDLFSFSPSIKGEAWWLDRKTIEFRPAKHLKSGQDYKFEFKLGKLLTVSENLQVFKSAFKVKNQSISVSFDGMSAYEDSSLEVQKQEGKILTADIATEAEVESVLSATQNGSILKIAWEHNGTVHKFTIDSLKRGEKRSELVCQWNGSSLGVKEKGEKTIEIPPLGNFKVSSSHLYQTPEQCVLIYFSDPLDLDQDLEGLIRLKSGENLRLEVNANTVKIYPKKRLIGKSEVIVETGVRNSSGYQLEKEYRTEVTFTSIKPNVELIGDGVIIPNSNGLIFPFKAVNLSGVNVKIIKVFENNIPYFLQQNQFNGDRELKRWGRIVYKKAVPLVSEKNIDYSKWNTFSLDLSEMIATEPGAIYRVHISFDMSQSLYPCSDSEEKEEEKDLFVVDSEQKLYDEPSGYYYDDEDNDYYEEYNYSDRDNPCKKSYYLRNRHSVVRNVLASNLGLIAKGGDGGKLWVAVTDIVSTEKLSDVDIELYNYQNQLITKGKTNAEGLYEVSSDKKPFLLIARKNNQLGYLRLDDGSALSLSMFNVSGGKTPNGVKGFIYGERGVWRPGDSLFVSFILEDKNQFLPKDHPVVFDLYSPDNQLFQRQVKTNSVNGFYDFRTATDSDSPTGNWLAKVKVGGASFTKTIKIETVKPNRLKIKLEFPDEILQAKKSNAGDLQVNWLHGAVASNLKVDVNLSLEAQKTQFKTYQGYTFDDTSKEFDSHEQTIFDGNVNADGKANLKFNLNIKRNAPGMLKAKFKTRAFEKGGDFSTDIFSMPYSPFASYVGFKIPKGKGWNDALYSNESNLIPIVTVDELGAPVSKKDIKIEVFEIKWRWWWDNSANDELSRYVRNQSSNLIHTGHISTKNGEAMYELNLGTETWGRKFIRITDVESGHSSGKTFYTSYKGWWIQSSSNTPGGAEMLSFSTDKKKYKVGEQVKVQLPTKSKGKVLVSIESGDKVEELFWVETSKENNSFSFEATEAMAPNVYIHVSYIQPYKQVDNDLPIRLYGVELINVEDPQTHLNPIIEMDDELRPEEKYTITVKEAAGKKMTYTLAIVDEGLLDLTRFNTPDAWSNFYTKEALGVKTWDMYKYVLGAYTGEMSGLLALGGDEDLVNKGGKKANRFKPVVKFVGPFELESGSRTHEFTMPNYIGSVKVMLVAGDNGSYGKTQKVCPVKKPLMVLGTLPRVVGPGESLRLPVTIFTMKDDIKNVKVSLETNELFKVKGNKSQNLTFEKQGEQMLYFDLLLSENIGMGKVKIVATSGNERAEYPVEIDVRLPNPSIHKVLEYAIEPGQTWEENFKAIGVEGTNKSILEISRIPAINLGQRLEYLIRYPHGCIEQTTSSVFPQLHLAKLMEISEEDKQKIEDNIREGIKRLKKFQLTDGGMTYWPDSYNEQPSDWGTNYAGHFMLEAKAQGYQLPVGFLDKWISFQSKRSNDWTQSNQDYYFRSGQLIQAYRLYTLALAGKPALGAMNRMREMNNLSTVSRWRLAAAYQLSGRENVAKDMISNLDISVNDYKEMSYSYGSSERDQAMILETLVLMNNKVKAKTVLDDLADKLSSNKWMSTQTTAYSLLAISKFVGVGADKIDLKYEFTLDNKEAKSINTTSPISQSELTVDAINSHQVKVTNTSNQVLFAKLQLKGIPLVGDSTSSSNNLKMNINYYTLDGKKLNPSRLVQGSDFIAEVSISHPGIKVDYKEMALSQIFPSGWEIRNLRLEGNTTIKAGDKSRYQDIRDDRVYTYFDIEKNKTKTYKVILNAAYLGRFYLPTVYCEAMYDNDINASQAGQWVEVISAIPVVETAIKQTASDTIKAVE
ncbi:hypothetical protein DWB61_11965 [Ancylomarina euxinus]|uniref:Alpha-2-macroglobulin n=1 Tax=Ancylomarina euxinus TaxID=2283627 RepID=A0A425XZV5_9BACT|nr:MG2 domain-containing protein [Ancylomarina euxinus]MCZ4695450.1 MG2 domain-containing protein [Ancylomarina euxinus]MUP15732.1 hypothetical protein [Ancylomarina euxinus]RRG20721.1 hypothetical protein DWB61_11965 [Ancylomarina euxinus]